MERKRIMKDSKNYLKILVIVFTVIGLAFSCTTMKKEDTTLSYIIPQTDSFNPKSTNVLFNRETFNLGVSNVNKTKTKDYTVTIKGSEDQVIYSEVITGEVKRFFDWDGKNSLKQIAQDGNYYAILSINTGTDNPAIVKSKGFLIDTLPLSVNIKLSTDMFSPGLVGKKDSVTLALNNASKKANWNGMIYNDAGIKVKNYNWSNALPQTVIWDGKDDNNKVLPDGSYYYQITASDFVGNKYESEKFDKTKMALFINQVKIYTKDVPVTIITEFESFNPKSAGKQNKEIFYISSNFSKDSIVSNWKVDIMNSKGINSFSFNGTGNLKPTLEWNGKLVNGTLASDDNYYAILTANFSSGSNSIGKSRIFSIDTMVPEIDIKLQSNIISPNGDGNIDTLNISQKGSKEGNWIETITNKDNKTVWTKSYTGSPIQSEQWNGKDIYSNNQINGMYKYSIQSTDKAGNSKSSEINFELKNLFTNAFITLSEEQFSSKVNSLKIYSTVSQSDDINSYKLEIINNKNNTIRTFQGTKTVPDFIEWFGLTDEKLPAPDGEYTARFSANYRYGNKVEVQSLKLTLKNSPPDVTVNMKPILFSPDSDGISDFINIDINAKDVTGIKNWSLIISTPNGKVPFMEFFGEGEPDTIVWNGINTYNETVESAEDYPVTIRVENNVGTVYEKKLDPIQVDILVIKLADGRYKIMISNLLFNSDTAELLDTQKNKDIITNLSGKLLKFNDYNITVEGHVNPYLLVDYHEDIGQKLSEARALAIAKMLDEHGISIKRMTELGKGGNNPVAFPNDRGNLDDSYLEKNRRVEFYLNK